jgi:hypothetical protein
MPRSHPPYPPGAGTRGDDPLALTEGSPSRRIAAMRAAGMALPLCLAVAISAVPAIWTTTAGAEESEASSDERPAPTIYKWVDEHGIAHYTTDFKRIPEGLRDRVGHLGPPDAALRRNRVEAGAPAREAATREAATREAAPAVGGEQWAVRDRSLGGPRDVWDEGDPYAGIPGSEAVAPQPGEDVAASEAEQEERRRQLEDLDERIASLRTDIAESEEKLKVLVAIPVPEGGGPLAMADDPSFREIATRLPKLLADLRALEDEREQLEAP